VDRANDELVGGIAGEGPAAYRDPLPRHGHADHHLGEVGALVLGVPAEAPHGGFTRAALRLARRRRGDPCLLLVQVLGELDVRVGGARLEVGGGGVHEDHVAVQVQQTGGARKDAFRDLGEGGEQEVHGAVGGVVGERRAAGERDTLGRPARGRELRAWLQGALRDEREHDALDELGSEAPAGGRLAQCRSDAEAREERVEHVGAAIPARVDDLDLFKARPDGRRLIRLEDAADRLHEAPQGLVVELVGAPEVVDHLGHGAAAHGMPLVVRELQVADHRAVLVLASCLAKVHAYKLSLTSC